jgi:hypothetical protein
MKPHQICQISCGQPPRVEPHGCPRCTIPHRIQPDPIWTTNHTSTTRTTTQRKPQPPALHHTAPDPAGSHMDNQSHLNHTHDYAAQAAADPSRDPVRLPTSSHMCFHECFSRLKATHAAALCALRATQQPTYSQFRDS